MEALLPNFVRVAAQKLNGERSIRHPVGDDNVQTASLKLELPRYPSLPVLRALKAHP